MTTVNVANTLAVPTATRNAPYYDDVDETKGFLRILARPGFAVQAREFTQSQSLQQIQLERFARHIFVNGSIVYGGQISFDDAITLNLQPQYANSDIDVSDWIGKRITHNSGNSLVIAQVIAGENATSSDPPILMIKYLTGDEFAHDTIIKVENEETRAQTNSSSSQYKANGLTASIGDGVFFINGFFVRNALQHIVLEKFHRRANSKIGLEVDETIVTELDDTSLLDPAQESANFQAPGAARLKMELTLAKRSLTSVDDTAFIELMRVQEGERVKHIKNAIYSELEETLARRTFDESGSYTVRPFRIQYKDDSANSQNLIVRLDAGKAYVFGYEFETISPTDITIPRPRANANVTGLDITMAYGNYTIVTDPKGVFDFTTHQIVDLHCVPYGSSNNLNAATYAWSKMGTARIRNLYYEGASNTQNGNTHYYRAYLSDTRFTSINSNAAVVTSNSIQFYDPSCKFSIDNAAYTNCTLRIVSGTGQGQALRITSYDGQSKNVRLANAFSTVPTTSSNCAIDFSFKDTESLIIATAGSSYTSNADISVYAKLTGNTYGDALILEGTYQSLVFPLSNRFIKDKTGVNNFMYRKSLGTVTFTAGVTTSIAPPTGMTWAGASSGTLSDTLKRTHYIIIPTSISSGTNVFVGKPLSFDTALGASITVSGGSITFNAGKPGDTFSATIYGDLDVNSGSGTVPKQKTKISPNTTYTPTSLSNGSFMSTFGSNTTVYLPFGQVHIQAPNRTPGQLDSLLVSDVKRINAIYDLAGTSLSQNQALSSFSEISSKYIFDNGMRDTFYDHGSLKLKNGVAPPTGPIVVCFQYYDHGAFGGGDSDGFFTLESYPDVTTTAGYGDVPFYIPEAGEPIALGDAIDFRPKRANADNTSPSFTLSGYKAIVPNEEFTVNYDYYLPRKDLVVLTRDRVFKVIQGTSSLTPYPPNDPDDAMVLYRLSLPPYVTSPTEILTRFVENKRYTMRDIGKLETRINNLEYYTNLNVLEKAANEMVIRDSNGLERTKFGIVADNFVGHQIGDVTNVDYMCSMDFTEGMLRPAANQRSYKLLFSTGDSNHQRNASTVTLAYTSENMVVQNAASKAENLNPYMIARFIGNMELTPDSDVWIDTDRKPDIVANLSGANDAYNAMADAINATAAMQTEWGAWETRVTGTSTSTKFVNTKTGASSTDPAWVNNRAAPGNKVGPVVQQTTTTTQGVSTRTGVQQQVSFETMTESLGDKVIDVSIIPWIRPLQTIFQASGLRPRRQVWFFFDQTPVLDFVQKPNVLRTRNANRFVSTEGINERITSTSTNSASVLASRPYESNTSQTVLLLANTIGLFYPGDTITGGTSGNTAVVDSFEHFSGNVVGGNTTTVTLQVGANRTNTDYVGNVIHIVAGSGLGSNSTITAYNYIDRNVTVSPAFSVAPTSNSKYSIGIHKTTNEGIIVGTYHLPSTDTTKFRTGDRMFRVLDQQDNDLDNATTRADARFTAQGLRQTKEAISVSVTVPKITTQTITETKAVTQTVTQQTKVRHDPLAQTFFVNEDQYPNGVFVTSVEVFFKSKANSLPVWVQLRPTVNGFPHSYVIYPFAHKTLYPDEVNISENPNAGNTQTKTVFTFSNPVYLQPGEHALIVQSDSLDYEAYVAELGKRQIGSDRVISEQPYLGSLFKSQNASTWTPFQFEDLMFVINKAAFTVGSTNIYFDTVPAIANAAMDNMFVQTNALVLSNTRVQNAYEVTESSTGVLESTFTDFVADSTHKFTTRKTVTTRQGSMNLRATLTTQSRDVSPMVDISRYNLIAIENIVNNANLSNALLTISNGGLTYSNIQNVSITITGGTVGTAANAKASANVSGNLTGVYLDTLGTYYVDRATVTVDGGAASTNATINIASELDSQGGPARARYITRKVILTDGFDAGDLRVFLSAYRPNGTELYVYYRVMNSDDPERFENKNWQRMAMATSLNRRSTKESDYIEYEFRPSTNSNTIVYQAGSTTFNSFNQYQIKIILLADNSCLVPTVKDMRCIALPGG